MLINFFLKCYILHSEIKTLFSYLIQLTPFTLSCWEFISIRICTFSNRYCHQLDIKRNLFLSYISIYITSLLAIYVSDYFNFSIPTFYFMSVGIHIISVILSPSWLHEMCHARRMDVGGECFVSMSITCR